MTSATVLKIIIWLIVFIAAIGYVIWLFINPKTYSSNKYSFQYPRTYSVEEEEYNDKIVTIIKGEKGRVEIFKMGDFWWERIIWASSTWFEKYEYKFKPKKKYEVGDYTIWIFYLEGDTKTESECSEIYSSFTLKS